MAIILVWHVDKFEQPPSIDVTTLSSGSDSSPVNNSKRSAHAKQEPQGRKNKRDSIKIDIGEESLLIKTEEPTDAKHENNQILSQGKKIIYALSKWNIP